MDPFWDLPGPLRRPSWTTPLRISSIYRRKPPRRASGGVRRAPNRGSRKGPDPGVGSGRGSGAAPNPSKSWSGSRAPRDHTWHDTPSHTPGRASGRVSWGPHTVQMAVGSYPRPPVTNGVLDQYLAPFRPLLGPPRIPSWDPNPLRGRQEGLRRPPLMAVSCRPCIYAIPSVFPLMHRYAPHIGHPPWHRLKPVP